MTAPARPDRRREIRTQGLGQTKATARQQATRRRATAPRRKTGRRPGAAAWAVHPAAEARPRCERSEAIQNLVVNHWIASLLFFECAVAEAQPYSAACRGGVRMVS